MCLQILPKSLTDPWTTHKGIKLHDHLRVEELIVRDHLGVRELHRVQLWFTKTKAKLEVLNSIGIYKKFTANIMFNNEVLNLSPKIGSKQRYPLPPFLFSVLLEILAGVIK